VEVRGGQEQLAPLGVLGGEGEHLLGVPRAQTGLDDQHRVAAADDTDVGHELDTAVRDHHQVAGEFLGLAELDERIVGERHDPTVAPARGRRPRPTPQP
jgi:hypothetical protein